MYLLGLVLLVLSSWYILKLFKDFKNDPVANKELDQAWLAAKEDAKKKNPFVKGRIKSALNSYKDSMNKGIANNSEKPNN